MKDEILIVSIFVSFAYCTLMEGFQPVCSALLELLSRCELWGRLLFALILKGTLQHSSVALNTGAQSHTLG